MLQEASPRRPGDAVTMGATFLSGSVCLLVVLTIDTTYYVPFQFEPSWLKIIIHELAIVGRVGLALEG